VIPVGRQDRQCARDSRLETLRLVLCACAGFATQAVAQEDIAAFKLSDVSADLTIGYTLDDREIGDIFTRSYIWTERLDIRTTSYVYHPALLEMEIGFGPLFVQGGYNSDDVGNNSNDSLFNYDANFHFLERKSYPLPYTYGVITRRWQPVPWDDFSRGPTSSAPLARFARH
jgi:hypothetical protein